MKAYYYISYTTDLVRFFDGQAQEPRIKEVEKELCSDMDEFRLGAFIRYHRIKERYPTATFHDWEKGAYVLVEGVLVYSTEVIAIDPNPVEVPEDDPFLGVED